MPRRVLMAQVALLACGCGDSTSPARELRLDFCAAEAPSFFALRNEGRAWTAVAPDANATFSFLAAERLTLLWVRQSSATMLVTTMIHAGIQDLVPLDGVECRETVGSRTLNGSVAGVASGSVARVSMGAARAALVPPNTSFQLTNLPDGAADVFAFSGPVGDGPAKFIMRRGVDPAYGVPLAVLDFEGAEAVATIIQDVTIENLQPGESNRLDLTYRTATITPFPFHSLSGFTTSPQRMAMLASGYSRPGDHYTIDVLALSGSGTSWRGDRLHFFDIFFPTPSLGEPLAEPAVSGVMPSSHPRFRVTLARQPTYPSFIQAQFEQPVPSARRVTVIASVRHAGLGDWDVELPDLGAVPGFPMAAALQTATETAWRVEAFQGLLETHLGPAGLGPFKPSVRLKYAGRSGTATVP